ncbi:MAG: hypothetical protein KGV56_00410 [Gammaproteobacteria bacterium]|nr:hypothetical protein [Gammaproteobacteria bacterium]
MNTEIKLNTDVIQYLMKQDEPAINLAVYVLVQSGELEKDKTLEQADLLNVSHKRFLQAVKTLTDINIVGEL